MEEIETLYSLELRKQQGEYLVYCKDGNERIWEFSLSLWAGCLMGGAWL